MKAEDREKVYTTLDRLEEALFEAILEAKYNYLDKDSIIKVLEEAIEKLERRDEQ